MSTQALWKRIKKRFNKKSGAYNINSRLPIDDQGSFWKSSSLYNRPSTPPVNGIADLLDTDPEGGLADTNGNPDNACDSSNSESSLDKSTNSAPSSCDNEPKKATGGLDNQVDSNKPKEPCVYVKCQKYVMTPISKERAAALARREQEATKSPGRSSLKNTNCEPLKIPQDSIEDEDTRSPDSGISNVSSKGGCSTPCTPDAFNLDEATNHGKHSNRYRLSPSAVQNEPARSRPSSICELSSSAEHTEPETESDKSCENEQQLPFSVAVNRESSVDAGVELTDAKTDDGDNSATDDTSLTCIDRRDSEVLLSSSTSKDDPPAETNATPKHEIAVYTRPIPKSKSQQDCLDVETCEVRSDSTQGDVGDYYNDFIEDFDLVDDTEVSTVEEGPVLDNKTETIEELPPPPPELIEESKIVTEVVTEAVTCENSDPSPATLHNSQTDFKKAESGSKMEQPCVHIEAHVKVLENIAFTVSKKSETVDNQLDNALDAMANRRHHERTCSEPATATLVDLTERENCSERRNSELVHAPSIIVEQHNNNPGEEPGITEEEEPTHMTFEELWEQARRQGIHLPARQLSEPRSVSSSTENSPIRDRRHHTMAPSLVSRSKSEDHSKKKRFRLSSLFGSGKKSATLPPNELSEHARIECENYSRRHPTAQIQKRSLPEPPRKEPIYKGSALMVQSQLVQSSTSPDIVSQSPRRSVIVSSFQSLPGAFERNIDSHSDRDGSSHYSASGGNADVIGSLRKLKDCGWYWGPLSWEGAESKLANKADGSFLVRDSSDDRYILSLSFRSQSMTHHTRIEHYKGQFSFYSQPKSHGATTIIEFIEKAMEHSRSGRFLYFLRPRAPGLPPAPVQLLYPLSRFATMRSLQHMCRFVILKEVRHDHIDRLPLPDKLKAYLRERQYYLEHLG